MSTQQGLRQQSVRDITGTAYPYVGDWMALFDLYSIPAGPYEGRLLAWLNLQMGTSIPDLVGAKQAFATLNGAYNWQSLGTFEVFSTEALTLFAAMSVQPTAARKLLIDQTIRSLIAAGVWAKIDDIGFIAGHTGQAGFLKWKSLTPMAESAAGGTFTVDRGYLSNGTTYLDTNYNPTTVAGNFTQNSAFFGMWSRTDAQSNGVALGTNPAAEARLVLRRASATTDAMDGRINDASNDQSTATVPSSIGWSVIDRPNGTTKRFFKNGAQVGTDVARNSSALLNSNILLGNNGGAILARETSVFAAGGSLTPAEHAALYGIIASYMEAVGAFL